MHARVVEGRGALPRPDGVQEHQRVAAAARLVRGAAARVEAQLGPPRNVHPLVKSDLDRYLRARPVRAAGRARRNPRGGRRRQADQLDAVVARVEPDVPAGHRGVRAAGRLEGDDGVRAVKLVKAAHTVECGSRLQQLAVAAYADQLGGVTAIRGHDGVRVAPRVEGRDSGRAVQSVKAVGAVERRVGRLHGAVVVDADQLDAVIAGSVDQRVRGAVHVKGGDAVRTADRVKVVGAVGRRPVCLQGAVAVHAEQPDDVAIARPGDHGVGDVARLECDGVDLSGYRIGDIRRHAGVGRHGAVAVHADHLDDAINGRPNHGVHAPISLDGVDV